VLRSWNARAALVAALGVGGAALALSLRSPLRSPLAAPPVRTARLASHGGPVSRAASAPAGEGAPDEEPAVDEPAVVETGGDPEQLGRHDLEAGMEKVRPAVEACQEVERFEGTVTVRLTIAKTGAVQSALVLPPADETATGACVLKAVRAASFRHFQGTLLPTVELTYPFLFRPPTNPP
jgi:TonB family protein